MYVTLSVKSPQQSTTHRGIFLHSCDGTTFLALVVVGSFQPLGANALGMFFRVVTEKLKIAMLTVAILLF
jgi:hypothetical protein